MRASRTAGFSRSVARAIIGNDNCCRQDCFRGAVILVHHTCVVTAIEAVMAVCAAVCSPVRMKAGCWASGPEDPRPEILGHIGRSRVA